MKTLLLVDDQEFNRSVLARRLRRRDFSVVLAENGRDCLEIAKDLQPALILLDMNLPDINGWEVAKQLKVLPECASIPIIGVSAHTGADAKQRALAAGCEAYETKPIDFQNLLRKIAIWTEPTSAISDP